METTYTVELTEDQIECIKNAVFNTSRAMWDHKFIQSIQDAITVTYVEVAR
jgi:hypothetical protein